MIVKLVSSEGIGTIAVGVAKAGADVINVAGNTGGTGAAAVTSLKYAGRSAEIGVAEVHQALCANGIRQKVVLRCSGAHQTASDVVKSALLGADSFEFGTTALMMLTQRNSSSKILCTWRRTTRWTMRSPRSSTRAARC
ncbi:citrate synthase [Mycobacteroides abscessus subsp. abscessus]|nr:citrate synthase [Mycobacteroides abscessus subsp. abscessus]